MPTTMTVNNKVTRLLNRWTIPPKLVEAYCSGNVIIQDGDEIIELFEERECRTCGRDYEAASRPKCAERPIILCCDNSEVNRSFGYVVPVCVDCFYYMQWLRGQKVPAKIQKRIDEGFTPYKIRDLI